MSSGAEMGAECENVDEKTIHSFQLRRRCQI